MPKDCIVKSVPDNVVHRLSGEVRDRIRRALAAKRRYNERMEQAMEDHGEYLQLRDEALELAEQEYPPLADPRHPSRIKACEGTVVVNSLIIN